ncbi:N-acetylated-alpha-linked acidic dipeptidase 2 [Magallana gigas]|uniref:N-acetylated-alpha-linked acidic dipeptidase 2 n=1 Tax=Magallana gigas TaxID=29159 RepID=UPI0033418346
MSPRAQNTRRFLLLAVVAAIVGLVIGLLIGRFGIRSDNDDYRITGISETFVQDADPTISEEIMDNINSDNIRQYLRELTEYPHLAGTDADYKQAKDLQEFWRSVGLDETFITPYDVLLSYPETKDESKMNRIFVYDSAGQVRWKSALYEPILDPSENKSNVVPPFNAYSAPGDVNSTDLVYVNYGRVEDYRWLAQNTDINITGKIVLARYGKIFRGDKARQAEIRGAKGIILYSDPEEYADDSENTDVYPHDWFLPESGTQRGSIYIGIGDPLTPGYPATETAYRLNESDPNTMLPKIPCHPIGYGVAKTLMSYMSGDQVPASWRGGLNITYRFGGPLKQSGWKIRIRISTANTRRKTYNVFGVIRGSVEPDRYVLLGNHLDAWVFGAIDPSSGTAVMKEVSRVVGNLVRSKKWRPRRTIIFCGWGAEEYMLMGSTEWVEQYVKNLGNRAVAYLNMDMAIEGNYTLRIRATPMMQSVVYDATKKVLNPDNTDTQFKTVYDKWLHAFPNSDKTQPRILGLGTGSDHAAFIQRAGLPSIDFLYTYNWDKYRIASYPLYHSKYETFKAVDEFMDRGFKCHRASGQVWAEVARNLADSLVIPFKIQDYANKLRDGVEELDRNLGSLMRRNSIQTDLLYEATDLFAAEVASFQKRVDTVDRKNPFAIRGINDQIMLMERAFVDPEGLPGRPLARHIVFAESSTDSYSSATFPGLVDGMFEIEGDTDEERRWEIVKKHFSVVLHSIDSAISTLRDVSSFMPLSDGL